MSRSLMFLFLMLVGTGTGWFLRGRMLYKADARNDADDPHDNK